MSVQDKAEYVRRQRHEGGHHCHWPGCTVEVKPALWGCLRHWRMLPAALRSRIWACYRPGQERDKRPSREYVETARAVQDWIEANHPAGGGRADQPSLFPEAEDGDAH